MRILITGGAGFIGSHLCDKYVKEGHIVICLDNFMNGNIVNIRHLTSNRNFKLINGDIRDFDLMEKVVPGVDAIFNMAAQVHVDRSVIEPRLTTEINILGTQNVLEVARMFDVKKVLHASSSEVYGSCQKAPMSEEHPLNATHPYGTSKIAADRLCYAYAQTYGLDIPIIRFFNTYGPRQKDMGYGGVISIFTRQVLNNLPPIIFGDGLQSRDFTYIDDVIRAYDLILNYPKKIEGPINFGTGKEITIIDLANKIIELCGKELYPVHVEHRVGEVRRLIADITKAKNLLGWEAEYDISKGLSLFIEWYKTNGQETSFQPISKR